MNTLKIIGMICFALVMLIISVGVISRLLGSPLLGVIELAEIFHFIVIIFSFSYTQTKKEHIAIGLLIDRYSPKVQLIFDNIAYVLTVSVCIVITYIFFLNSMEETKTTLLLDFPFMVLKIIVTIGFFVWGLVALSQISFKTPPVRRKCRQMSNENDWDYFHYCYVPIANYQSASCDFDGCSSDSRNIDLREWNVLVNVIDLTIMKNSLSYTMTTIAMFVLMGELMNSSGISNSLYDTFKVWFGKVRGGMALATVTAGAMFAASSGSSIATTASLRIDCLERDDKK